MPVSRKRRPRGYPIAILVGFENKKAIFWNVYSKSVKPGTIKNREDNDYNFFESLVDELRPSIKQGVKIILLASMSKKKYDGFMGHIEKHQSWMLKGYKLNRVEFQYIEGSARDVKAVKKLVDASYFWEKIRKVESGEMKMLMSVLDERLASRDGIESLLFSLKEVEDALYGELDVEYILTSQMYQEQHRRRIQRLFQIAENKGVMTRILPSDSPYVERVAQFGGLICLLRTT